MHGQRLGRERTHALAHAALLADLQDETIRAAHEVGKTDVQLMDWMENRSEAEFERAPHIGTLREILYHRLRGSADRWEPNDLLDMNFLSCAAGYADLVVAEKKFTDYLARARRTRPTNAIAVATLSEAVADLT